MNILFYTPFFHRSRDTESLMIAFKKQGHEVYFITQEKRGPAFEFLQNEGIACESKVFNRRGSLIYYLKHLIYLIYFCRKNKIDIVYSHLEPAHLIAVFAQFFIRGRVYICRHHIDEQHIYNLNKKLTYKIVYKLARKIIVVSEQAIDFMTKVEKVKRSKIIHINLAYDFNLYNQINENNVREIKNSHKAGLVIAFAGRLVSFKRAELCLELAESLIKDKIDVKFLILGDGPVFQELRQLIHKKNLEDICILLGHKTNILDYMAASDLFFHPSISESSCVVVKEAGLVKKPVIVCKGIGDFDNYIMHGVNGILVDQKNPVPETLSFLTEFNADRIRFRHLGENLYKDVNRLFSIKSVLPAYNAINS